MDTTGFDAEFNRPAPDDMPVMSRDPEIFGNEIKPLLEQIRAIAEREQMSFLAAFPLRDTEGRAVAMAAAFDVFPGHTHKLCAAAAIIQQHAMAVPVEVLQNLPLPMMMALMEAIRKHYGGDAGDNAPIDEFHKKNGDSFMADTVEMFRAGPDAPQK